MSLHHALDFLLDTAAAETGIPAPAPVPTSMRPSPIQRKSRLVMRDPQQAVHAIELPSFGASETAGVRQMADPGIEAAHLVEEARQAAEAMLAQTRAACEQQLEAARASGYEAGYAAGMEAADEEASALIGTAEQIAVNVSQERERLLAEAEGDVVELAITIAKKLVNAAIDVEPELVVEVCRGAMRKAFQRETLSVRAHPDDLEALRSAGPRLAAELGGVQHLEFVEERRLQRGSLIVRTPAGEIDASFDGKAEKIADAMRELVRTRSAEARHAA